MFSMARAERRAEERLPRVALIRYFESAPDGGRGISFLNLAITSNVSPSGVSFRSLKPMGESATIKLVNDTLWKAPREGVVRWCTETAPGIYKVGVAFV